MANNTRPWRKSLRLQTAEQQPLAMLKLLRGQESSHQHEGREPRQSQGCRRRLVSTARGKLLTGELKAEKTFREVLNNFYANARS